ncbi:FxSxx-COOH system tetratricopeptide repeat protein [Streptomyces sp. NPDC047000]|uniref:FxSxx-COOH system tetratricopeptide repeat protein n=1 Tax=Streptomyces sp. NPDC047000 TaxID=3155474 RepID=UPI0033DF15EC
MNSGSGARSGLERRDFFISYTGRDRAWAEWIGWQLEDAGHTLFLQDWDFGPGENVVERMRDALESADRTIALVSPHYLASPFCRDQWTSAFLEDEYGRHRLLLIRVEPCRMPRLFRSRSYVDLVRLSAEECRERLLGSLRDERRKPAFEPPHPHAAGAGGAPRFPGRLHISNLPPRSPAFCGRTTELLWLQRSLFHGTDTLRVSAVYGLGGVGKTQLVNEYAHVHEQDYDVVWWVPAELPVAIPEALVRLARRIGLPEERNQSEMLGALWDAMRDLERWLLVYDNVETALALAPYLPPAGSGHILITSRSPAWGLTPAIELRPLCLDDAVAMLLRRVGDEDRAVLTSLAVALGSLPLALEQAASYIEATRVAPEEYLQMFHEHGAELLAVESTLIEQTVAATWRVALDRVRQQAPAAQSLLALCSYLHPEDIPRALITEGVDLLPAGLRDSLSRGFAFNQALAVIHRYSLIHLTRDALSLHRLVQTVIRAGLPPDEAREWAGCAVRLLNSAFPNGGSDAGQWDRCGALLPHALEAVENAGRLQVERVASALLLSKVSTFLWGRADLPQARRLLERSIALESSADGGGLRMADRLNDLGLVLWDMARLAEARAAHEQAYNIRSGLLGERHPDLALSLNNLGGVLCDLEDYDAACEALGTSRSIWEEAGAPPSIIALSLTNLGVALRGLGRLPAARAVLERAWELWEAGERDGEGSRADPADGGELMDKLGHIAGIRACCERDLPGDRRAVTDAEAVGPLAVPAERRVAREWAAATRWGTAAATTLDNLGTVLASTGELTAARQAFLKALAIRELRLGAEHPDVAWSLSNVAVVLADLGELTQAKSLLEEALRIRESTIGPDHPDVATSLNNLATVELESGGTTRAIDLMNRCLRIRREALSADHAATKRAQARLILLHK